jgi:hypothetical protein
MHSELGSFWEKHRPSCHSGKKTLFLCLCIVVMGPYQFCGTGSTVYQFVSRSLLVRIGSLKELYNFGVPFSALDSHWNPSCGKIRWILEPNFTFMDALLKGL